jgi:SAM-dependent methyltransferase
MKSFYTDHYSAYATSRDSVARAKRALFNVVTEDFRASGEGRTGLSLPARVSRFLRKALFWAFRKRLIRLPPTREGGRLLDIGCGVGFDLDLARKIGWDTYGIEVSAKPVEICRRKGHCVFHGKLGEANYPNDFFDAVSLWNVLEHLHQPVTTMTEISRILAPGGYVLLRVPDVGSCQARLFGDKWYPAQHVPHHLYLFSFRTVSRLLEKTGFETVYRAHMSSPRSTLRYCRDMQGGRVGSLLPSIPALRRALDLASGTLLYVALELAGWGEQLIVCARSGRMQHI